MKKIKYILLLISSVCFAQFNVTDLEGNIIENGTQFNYDQISNAEAKLKFKTVNTSDATIDIRVRCTGITNTDGIGFQLCYGGLCYDNVEVNGVYPNFQNIIAPGQDNGPSDYFLNNVAGNGTDDLIYSFRVFALDLDGNVVGQSVNLTYRYSPEPLSINSFQALSNLGINLKNTIAESSFEIQSSVQGTVNIFSLNGQLVQTIGFQEGNFSIDLSAYQTTYYLLNFATTDGKTATIKVLKK